MKHKSAGPVLTPTDRAAAIVAAKVVCLGLAAWASAVGGYVLMVAFTTGHQSPHDLIAMIFWGTPIYVVLFGVCILLVSLIRRWSPMRSPVAGGLVCGAIGCMPILERPFRMIITGQSSDSVATLLLQAIVIAGLPGGMFGAGLSVLWLRSERARRHD